MAYEKQITEDGSITFWNEKFGQSYHSKHGAYREALEKHVQACKISELAFGVVELNILDICFGLGYNSFVAIVEALKVNPNLSIKVMALENDPHIIGKISEIEYPDSLQAVVKDFLHDGGGIEIIYGDARKTIKKLQDNFFDAIFFDPFSLQVCPELWTAEFISTAVLKAKPGAYISTYSCARLVKDNFKNAGCEIFEGPKCGRRDGGVLARKL